MDRGVRAVYLVEVEPSPEHEFVTTLPLPMGESVVLDLQLKLYLVIRYPAQVSVYRFS